MKSFSTILMILIVGTGAMTCAGGAAGSAGSNHRTAESPGGAIGLTPASGSGVGTGFAGPAVARDSVCPMTGFGLTGRVYYYCDCSPTGSGKKKGKDRCRPGRDSNEGSNTSPANPARGIDLAFARFNKLAPGEKIAMCRDGVFAPRKQIELRNTACKPGRRCGIIDYTAPGTSGVRRPVLRTNGHGLIFSNPGASARDGGYFARNLNLRGRGLDNSAGVLIYNEADDVHLCGLRVDGFDAGIHVARFKGPPRSGDGLSDRIELRKSEIVNNASQGWLGGGNGFLIQDNYFYNNGHGNGQGGSARFSHSIYVSGNYGSHAVARNMKVSGNRIEKSVHGAAAGCRGAVIAVHGRHDGLVIEDNRIIEREGSAVEGCRGIKIAPAYETPELLRNITVQRNRLEFVGADSILTKSCENCSVRDNKIVTRGY